MITILESMLVIYGLVDPRTGCLRYIGKTGNLSKRRSKHMRVKPHERSLRAIWLRELAADGVSPELILLEDIASQPDAEVAERFWISSLRAAGAILANQTAGGTGGSTRLGSKHSAVARSKIAASHIGIRPNAETRAKLSRGRMGRRTGIRRSEQERANISAGLVEWWRQRRS